MEQCTSVVQGASNTMGLEKQAGQVLTGPRQPHLSRHLCSPRRHPP
uniref:Uncharacterized protein n=1 Tax=Arundo donax TaxID=35708 RepID=A0A0A9E981_ARUDO